MMGARLVSAVYAMYPELPHRAKHAAVVMALRALDEPHDDRPARRYFAGLEPIADGLGYARDESGEHTPATLRTVARVLAELHEAGVYEVVRQGRGGRCAVYDLNLDPFEGRGLPKARRQVGKGKANPSLAVAAGLQPGRDSQAEPGRGGPTSLAVAAIPRNHEEPPEEPRRGQDHLSTEPHQRAAGDPLEPLGLSDDERSGFLEWLRARGARSPEGLIRTQTEDQLRRDVEEWRKRPRSSWDRLPNVTDERLARERSALAKESA